MRYRRSSRVWRSSRPPPWLPIPAIPPISRVKQQVALSSLFAFIIIVLLLIHTVGYSHGKQGFVESWWTWNRTRISPLRHADRSNDNHTSLQTQFVTTLSCSLTFRSSCRHLGQPQICCPDPLICEHHPLTPSTVFCCEGRLCEEEAQGLALFCPWNYHECPAAYGGGCCHYTQRCAPEGCEELRHPELENVKQASGPDEENSNTKASEMVGNGMANIFPQSVLRGGDPISGPQDPPTGAPRGFRGWREEDIPLSQRMGLVPTRTTVKFGELAATADPTGSVLENGSMRVGFYWELTLSSLGALAAVMFAL